MQALQLGGRARGDVTTFLHAILNLPRHGNRANCVVYYCLNHPKNFTAIVSFLVSFYYSSWVYTQQQFAGYLSASATAGVSFTVPIVFTRPALQNSDPALPAAG
jgi:hypothetical protein